VTKTATLLGVSRASFQGYVGIHESWKDNISKEEQWAKINIERKRSLSIEKDCLKHHRTSAALGDWTVELNVHLGDPVSIKTVQCQLHKSIIHSMAAIAERLITESDAHMHKQQCHDHKAWTTDN
jgi:hypothetical protein